MAVIGSRHEQWHAGLEEAARLYFDQNDIKGSIKILAPLHMQLNGRRGPQTIDQLSFARDYEADLVRAGDLCFTYQHDLIEAEDNSQPFPDEANVKRLNEAWELYHRVFGRLENQLKVPVKPVVPLVQRKRDLVYLVYFFIHILVIIFVDAAALLQPHQRPAISNTFFKLQSEGYGDQFFAKGDIQFFNFFRLLEICLHLPVSVWALRALQRDDYKVPLILLPFAIQVAVTTATCMYDYTSWTEIDYAAKWNLTTLYGPYLILSVFMTVDMYGRLKRSLSELQALRGLKKTA